MAVTSTTPRHEAGQPTHYQILDLPPSLLDSQQPAPPLLRRAYHRALLRHHPDKAAGSPSTTTTNITIDQISLAFATLSDPAQRAAYDRALKLSHRPALPSAAGGSSSFQTGIEAVDLDDLACDVDDDDGGGSQWYRACRCGNERGFAFGEADLESAADLGELLVGCLDCSLWLRVHFAVVEEEE